MPTNQADRLRAIKTLPSLIAYLRDDLGWPIQRDMVDDDLVFEYLPEEIGISAANAVWIKEIKQLRPMDAKQPWGIFWINFEKKRLPLVMLRRILGHLVVKKRASAQKSSQRTWQMSDLLFISAYGEETDRAITFAHFAEDEYSPGDLPVLKVLGWDGADTVLHLTDAHRLLKEKLRWPDDPENVDVWRQEWGKAFVVGHREVVNTTQELVEELAKLATSIRRQASTILSKESDRGPMKRLYAAFKTALIHDLTEDDFADVIAQTISYGLLVAKFSRPAGISVQNLVDMIPPTNPFLKELLGEFLTVAGRRKGAFDFDELGIQDVVALLNRAKTEAIKLDFGDRRPGEDPVIHFYEHFLSTYDKKRRIQRGVFFTPQPVVSYIVRSVHEILQTEFGLADGLADTTTWGAMLKKHQGLKLPPLTDEPGEKRTISPDEPFVQILDPATGTATFLIEVIDIVHRTLSAKWKHQHLTDAQQSAEWNDYVPQHLLPRLHAYELMMAPYAIAHMKIGLKLAETGYRFGNDERARVYLTNALEPWAKQLPLIGFDALAHEAAAVNEIKRHKRFTVVIGNPPYAGISSNMSEFAQRIVDAYRIAEGAALNEKKVWLQDDYVKFIRKAQTTIESAGIGVFGYITNHGYFDNPTFRGMRQSLMSTFQCMRLLDLHGNANKKEQSPDGSEDKNVFDIRQGVAVCLAHRASGEESVGHSELWGTRESKYAWLANHHVHDSKFSTLTPDSPFYLFEPQNTDSRDEYNEGIPVTEVFPFNVSGIVTARDGFVIGFEDETIKKRIKKFLDPRFSDAEIKAEFELNENYAWRVGEARKELRAEKGWEKLFKGILYRPFDSRRIIYHKSVVFRTRADSMRHMFGERNLALSTTRSIEIGRFEHVFCTREIMGHHTVSLKEVNYMFPLWLLPNKDDLFSPNQIHPNLSPRFLRRFSEKLGMTQTAVHGLPADLMPEDIFYYAYTVLHSPGYRTRYAEFLKIDFPRLPLTSSLDLFRALAKLGGELVALHLMESPKLNKYITKWTGGKNSEIEKVSYSDLTVCVDRAKTIGFTGVPEEVWSFHIGGYQVCEKWLKDRKGRKLSKEDIEHYQKVVVALSETIRIMAEIDKVIDQYGGWPGAFSASKND